VREQVRGAPQQLGAGLVHAPRHQPADAPQVQVRFAQGCAFGRDVAIVKREELVRDVLHRALSPFDRSMDTHVANLRRKLGHQVDGVERIKTVRGIGYIYATPSTTPKREQ